MTSVETRLRPASEASVRNHRSEFHANGAKREDANLSSFADLITDATRRLTGRSDSPRLDAEVLLRHAAGLDRTGLLIALRDDVPPDLQERFDELITHRATGVPVAYLTGTREFMGLPFEVDENVLVPRPETELLVEWALARLEQLEGRQIRVVDVGSGSGAIAVSIAALAHEPVNITAVEPSAGAREVIARNRDALLAEERRSRFTVVDDDLLTGAEGPFDIVLANLPYLTPDQIAENPDLDAEPRMALDGGSDGLDLIERLIAQLSERVAESFAVGLELDPSQATNVAELLIKTLPGSDVSIIRDYAGLDRHVVAMRTKDEPTR